jgi:2-(3-amino-3-carboxypropyl)histidine synthase
MQTKKLEDIEEIYELELDRIVSDIKKKKAKLVLLQFPDGLKPWAIAIVSELEKRTKAEFMIWLGSCYGACDTPQVGNVNVDLIVQFGHSKWK